MGYNLNKEIKEKNLVYFSYKFNGLVLNTKKNKQEIIGVTRITLIDPKLINKFVKNKIDKNFIKLFKQVYYFLNTPDTDESDARMVLGELNKLQGILINKYREFLTVKELKEFMEKIKLLETEVKKKVIFFAFNKEENIEEKKERSR